MAGRKSNTWISSGNTIDTNSYEGVTINKNNLADYILNLKPNEVTYDLIMNIFGTFEGKSLANPYDILEVPANKFSFIDFDGKEKSNTSKFTTTIGIYIMNLIMKDCDISKIFEGYINNTFGKKQIKKIQSKLAYALIEDDITTDHIMKWENYCQWMMPFEDILSPNHTEKMITCSKVIEKKKKELMEKYKKELEAGDVVIAEKIEKELLNFAMDYLKDDPSLDVLYSGGGGSEENFKNMYIMKGAVKNPDPTAKKQYDIITSSYIDGIKPEEYTAMAGSGTSGAYYRGVQTETGGYWEKLFISAYQHIKLDPVGSDCGTSRTIEVLLTDDNIDGYMYSYAVRGSSLVRIDSKTRDSFIGKKTKIRFSSLCESKTGICNKCAGDLLYQSVANIGVTISQIPDTLKLRCMKLFHSSAISTKKFNANLAFYGEES